MSKISPTTINEITTTHIHGLYMLILIPFTRFPQSRYNINSKKSMWTTRKDVATTKIFLGRQRIFNYICIGVKVMLKTFAGRNQVEWSNIFCLWHVTIVVENINVRKIWSNFVKPSHSFRALESARQTDRLFAAQLEHQKRPWLPIWVSLL